MTEKELLKYCRYYKGEGSCPSFDDANKIMLWHIERDWVRSTSHHQGEDADGSIDEYLAAGLRTFNLYDDTPLSLKAALFHRFLKTQHSISTAIEPFKVFYSSYYSNTRKGS